MAIVHASRADLLPLLLVTLNSRDQHANPSPLIRSRRGTGSTHPSFPTRQKVPARGHSRDKNRSSITDPPVIPTRMWIIWITILVAIGWAISQGMQAFLQAYPRPTLRIISSNEFPSASSVQEFCACPTETGFQFLSTDLSIQANRRVR